jgi:hypothetical protein
MLNMETTQIKTEKAPDRDEIRLCSCGNGARRRGNADCLVCHHVSVKASRLRRQADLKARFMVLEAAIDKLAGVSDPATRRAFEARCRNRFVVVWPDQSAGKKRFDALVIKFLEGDKLLVMTYDRGFQQVPLERVTQDPARVWNP